MSAGNRHWVARDVLAHAEDLIRAHVGGVGGDTDGLTRWEERCPAGTVEMGAVYRLTDGGWVRIGTRIRRKAFPRLADALEACAYASNEAALRVARAVGAEIAFRQAWS